MRAIVVGGGIGGLSAAIALRRAGVEAAVFERASEPREIGAGVGLWSNAVGVLKSLSLYEAGRGLGAEIGGEVRSWRGRKLFEFSADELRQRYGEANLLVHRADLQSALLSALPEETVRFGACFVGFNQERAGGGRREPGRAQERGPRSPPPLRGPARASHRRHRPALPAHGPRTAARESLALWPSRRPGRNVAAEPAVEADGPRRRVYGVRMLRWTT